MSIYDRQSDLGLETDISVFIVGMGGVGFNVALQLAMSGVPQFYLCDYDTIEAHNLNRIPVTMQDIGNKKVHVAKQQIKNIRDQSSVIAFDGKFREMMLPSPSPDWIVDCSDLLKVQVEIHSLAESRGINYCKLGYDGDNVSMFSSPAQWGVDVDSEEEEQGGYTVTPSWSAPANLIASLGVAKILKYHDAEISTSLENIFE